MNHSNISKPAVAAVFILSQISLNGLLLYMSINRGFHISDAGIIIIFIVSLTADLLYLFYFLSFIRRLYLSEFSRETEKRCRSLYERYLEYGRIQKEYQKETHDVLNAQFTYHTLLEQGKTEEAEQFRRLKCREWKENHDPLPQ